MIMYDTIFLNYVANGDKSYAVDIINDIVKFAQGIYEWPSFEAKFKLEVIEIKHIDKKFKNGANKDSL